MLTMIFEILEWKRLKKKKIIVLVLITYTIEAWCYQMEPRESPPFEGYEDPDCVCIDN